MEFLLILLATASKPQIDAIYCEEMAPVLQEAVENGYLTRREAMAILYRCYEANEHGKAPILA